MVLETISALHEASKKVVCYISIGTWEVGQTLTVVLGSFPSDA